LYRPQAGRGFDRLTAKDLNPSIATYTSDVSGKAAGHFLLGLREDANGALAMPDTAAFAPAWPADVRFELDDGTVLVAHKAIVASRSPVLCRLLTGGFAEGEAATRSPTLIPCATNTDDCGSSTDDASGAAAGVAVVRIRDACAGAFSELLTYLYTDHANLEALEGCGSGEGGGGGGRNGSGAGALLALANRFLVPRLVALCELYVSKRVEAATAISVSRANVDLAGLAAAAAAANAPQLRAFCLHFIAVNWSVYEHSPTLAALDDEAAAEVNAKRWPPASYFDTIAAYEASHASKSTTASSCVSKYLWGRRVGDDSKSSTA